MQVIERIHLQNRNEAAAAGEDGGEPVFLAPEKMSCPRGPLARERIMAFLSRQIVREPADLQLHLRRIELFRQQQRGDGVYGGLLDLFLVLRDKGRPLRQRLLNRFAGCLEPAQKAALARGVAGASPPPASRCSMLQDGRRGRRLLVIRQQGSRAAPARDASRDVIEDARDLIDSGQVGAATVLLKKALLVNPRREDVGRELMLIYRHSRNREAVARLLQGTRGLPLAERGQWESLLAELTDANARAGAC